MANGVAIPCHSYFVSDLYFQNKCVTNVAIVVFKHPTDNIHVSGIFGTNVLAKIPSARQQINLTEEKSIKQPY